MKRYIASLLLVTASFALSPLAASAAPITVPSGLNPGDQYRLVFVTSTTRDARSEDIADYNQFVTDAANTVPALAELGTTWAAIASTSTVDARDNTDSNPGIATRVPFYSLAGTKVATDNFHLWSIGLTPLLSPIDYTETGDLSVTGSDFWDYVYTGTDSGGQCYDFGFNGLGLSSGFTELGSSTRIDAGWIQSFSLPPYLGIAAQFYAMSGVLTVPIPEPSSILLTGIALAGLAVVSLCQRRHCKTSMHDIRDHI